MANRKNTFLIKRSNVAGKKPSAGDLLLGELAINTADGILYTSGTTAGSILPIGWDRVAKTGDTMTGGLFTPYLSATTISATTYVNLPSMAGSYLPLSGGTVYGPAVFSGGLTANTLNVTGLTQTSGITSTGGITFKQVTINSTYSATTSDYMIDVTGGTFTVYLPSAVGIQGRLLVVKNNGGGAVTVDPYGSQTIDGKPFVILGETNTIQLASNGTEWVALSYNISTVNSSTGVFEFTGLTKLTSSTFRVAPVKGWIVDDTTNPLSPQLYYVTYSGGTHTATYLNTATETWVYLTSGGTISQSNVLLTDQQRRQNIFLGKLGHSDKTTIINAFSQPDFVLSPLSQLRDMFDPIGFVNEGVRPSANGVNLSFNTSAGYLHGLGINFANDTLNPNTIYVSGTSPCTFQYRTQTGGTPSNVTVIDPTKYDVGGVITSLSGTKATNQRIYLIQNGVFRVQYGQTEYSNLTQAIAGLSSEPFIEFSNFTTNGILIGILSVLSSVTDLSDTTKAQFFNVSKFGDSAGAAGGSSTTTLQQAYNNSTNPEIITNSTLNGVQFRGGTGSDTAANIIIENNSSYQTGQWLANGTLSATTLQTGSLTANTTGVSATTISATTYQGLPTDVRVTGGTYSSGTATFTNNTGGTFTVTGFTTTTSSGSTSPISVISGSSLFSTGLVNSGVLASAVTYSIFFGEGAGYQASAATQSTLLGNSAGYQATNANNSQFIGGNAGYQATGASYSTFIGNSAGAGAVSSSNATFIGFNAGNAATNAGTSVFVGYYAGKDATSASSSVFIGQQAGQLATAANNSTFIGNNAGYQATAATNSSFMGYAAGYLATGANLSNFIGYGAGRLATNAYESTFIGHNAGSGATSANTAVFLGFGAGFGATSANRGVFIGSNAGGYATGSYESTFIGLNAGFYAYDSYDSIFMGYQAGYSATTSYYSNLLGYNAGQFASNTSFSNIMGYNAGYGASSSANSNFIGRQAGYGSTGATVSNFVGLSAGQNATDSTFSNFIGYNAGYGAISTANANLVGFDAGNGASGATYANFIGSSAGQNAIGSTNSNFIGHATGQYATNVVSSNYIGYAAGFSASSVNYSNFLGFSSGYQATGASYSNIFGFQAGYATSRANSIGSNNIIIGTNITLPVATANAINIGGVLFGSGTYSTTAGNPSSIANNGKIGINVVTPLTTLHVSGGTLIQGGLTANTISATTYYNLPPATFTGGTVNGSTNFTNGLTANTISATTYYGLPKDVYVTGVTYSSSAGTATFTNNTGGTFSVTGLTNSISPISVISGSSLFSTGLSNTGVNASGVTNSLFLGSSAGQNATGANSSQFLGAYAGNGATSASNSNFFGVFAGQNATNATGANFIGGYAGDGATFSNDSIFMGSWAGQTATNADSAIFLGFQSGQYAARAAGSVFIGYNSGLGATSASTSVFIGVNAGGGAIGGYMSNFIGNSAGQGATGASYSNLFGFKAGQAIDAGIGSNNTIIGTNISLPTATSNAINIGGVLFGTNTYSTITGNPLTGATSGGRIGIGIVNPLATLHVSGNTLIQGTLSATTISATTYLNLPSSTSGTTTGNGTTNYLARWTGSTSLSNSIIQDNGVGASIGTTPNNNYKLYTFSSTGTSIFAVGSTIGVLGQATNIALQGNGGTYGVYGNGVNDNGTIGVYGSAGDNGSPFTSSVFIGGKFLAGGTSGTNYGLQIQDGTEGVNKVLISTSTSGTTNWSSTLSGLTSVYANTLSATTINATNIYVTGGTQSLFSGNSSSELVKIIQTGSGDAFVVEDEANGDSSHFVINASGNTAIGLTQPIGNDKLTVSGNTTVYGALSATTVSGDGSGLTNVTANVPYGLITAISTGNYLI